MRCRGVVRFRGVDAGVVRFRCVVSCRDAVSEV